MTLFTLNIDFVLQICATGFEATSKLMTAILEIKKFNFYAICNSLAYFFFYNLLHVRIDPCFQAFRITNNFIVCVI